MRPNRSITRYLLSGACIDSSGTCSKLPSRRHKYPTVQPCSLADIRDQFHLLIERVGDVARQRGSEDSARFARLADLRLAVRDVEGYTAWYRNSLTDLDPSSLTDMRDHFPFLDERAGDVAMQRGLEGWDRSTVIDDLRLTVRGVERYHDLGGSGQTSSPSCEDQTVDCDE